MHYTLKLFKNTFLTLLLCIFCSLNIQNARAEQFVLKVMNYNVKGVPVFWYWHFRHQYIGKYLAELKKNGKGGHLIALQEMMDLRTRRIHKIAKYIQIFQHLLQRN